MQIYRQKASGKIFSGKLCGEKIYCLIHSPLVHKQAPAQLLTNNYPPTGKFQAAAR